MADIGLMPCSGLCNIGMISTRAVVDILDKNYNTGFVCALGFPLGIERIIANGKKSDYWKSLSPLIVIVQDNILISS